MTTISTLVVRGVLAVAVGIIAVAWPDITIGAFVILFAVYAFLMGLMEAARAFGAERAGSVVGRLVLALLNIAAGIVALAWPQITALVLVLWVAGWAFVTGMLDVVLAFTAGKQAGERALLGLGGLVSIALAIVLVIRPDIGAVALAQIYGLFSLVSGIALLVMAVSLRQATRATSSYPTPGLTA